MKPRVVVSRCLGFEACRYNGERVESAEVDRLRHFMEFIAVCPGVDAELGVPRNPINLLKHGEEVRVVQTGTGLDMTELLSKQVDAALCALKDVNAFILKARSPSCGLDSTTIWDARASLGLSRDE